LVSSSSWFTGIESTLRSISGFWEDESVGGRVGGGVVIATGMAAELARIARLLRDVDEVKTPLQKRLGQRLALPSLVCAR
jgi:magnesium-transporting ATPase (P-type)